MQQKRILISYYKFFINPIMPNTCIYTPSCSAYMGQSISKFGLLKGSLKGILRILRCNPFAKGGFDPVKDNLKGQAKWLL